MTRSRKGTVYHKLINTGKWQRLRNAVLREHPMCQHCEANGLYVSATEVHHIVPVESVASPRDMESLMYNPSNLAALCRDCHRKAHAALAKGTREANAGRQKARVDDFMAKFGLA